MLWRRSYDTPPPPISDTNEYSQADDPRYADLGDTAPKTECLADVVARMESYLYGPIFDDLKAGKTVLVAAHGNSLRAVVKMLDGSATRASPRSTCPPASRSSTSSTTTSSRSPPGGDYLDPEAAAAAITAVANQGTVASALRWPPG